MWLSNLRRHKGRVLCFVDDDREERRRFQEAMESEFLCVTAETYEACKKTLNDRNLKPTLWVLDLYLPSPDAPPPDQGLLSERKKEMLAKYEDLEQRTRDFQRYLKDIDQGPEGGLNTLQKCKSDYRVPAVMFTRKGTLDNAIACIDAGAAAVLKKPMPFKLAGSLLEKEQQLDEAMMGRSKDLRAKFRAIIESNSFWNRHKGALSFLFGIAATVFFSKSFEYLVSWFQQ